MPRDELEFGTTTKKFACYAGVDYDEDPICKKLWCDTETRSKAELKTQGTYRYAEVVKVIIFTFALDDDEVEEWDVLSGEPIPLRLKIALNDNRIKKYFHNGGNFDSNVIRFDHELADKIGRAEIPIHEIHDTMVAAMTVSLPGALGTLGPVLNVGDSMEKSNLGMKYINLFCKPNKKTGEFNDPKDFPVEWRGFKEYAKQDIVTMREVDKRTPKWNYSGKEYDLWVLDQKINRRGVQIDMELVRAALRAIDKAQIELSRETQELTNGMVESTTKRDQLLQHILNHYISDASLLPNMKKATLAKLLKDDDRDGGGMLPPVVRQLIENRLQASMSSTAKFVRLMGATSSDERLRGILQFCGAIRTGRWAGRIFQPQNLPRMPLEAIRKWYGLKPEDKLPDEWVTDYVNFGIKCLKLDCEELFFDEVMPMLSACIRGAIIPKPGKKLVVADLSNIEGRFLAWLAGEQWKIQAFRDFDTIIGYDEEKKKEIRKGEDLYLLAYARAFNILAKDVRKEDRQIGKVMDLGLGYGGGVGAFVTFALVYNLDLEEMARAALPIIPADILEEAEAWWHKAGEKGMRLGLDHDVFVACDSLKRLWRRAHPMTVKLWTDAEDGFRNAILNKGKVFTAGRCKIVMQGAWLKVKLPSGRIMCYPYAQIGKDGSLEYKGVSQFSRKWVWIKTYGGKLVENWTQGGARDVLGDNMQDAEDAGYEIVLDVHDELLTETPDEDQYTAEGLAAIMARNKEWSAGLPLAAAGFEAYRYGKG